MSVYQNKTTGKWYYKFMFEGRTYHRACKGVNSYKEAEACEIRVKNALLEGRHEHLQKKKRVTLQEAVDLYIGYSKVNKRSHQLDINYTFQFVEFFGKDIFLEHITPQMLEDFKSFRLNKVENSNAAVNRYIEAFSKMCNLCIQNNLLKNNPCKHVAKLKQKNHKIRFLTKDEEARLFEQVEGTYLYPIVLCALHTGMRRGEILDLKWENISGGYIELLETKSGKARKVPISDKLQEIFDDMDELSEYVFTNPDTKTRYKEIKKGFNNAVSNAKIKNFRFHDLRHTVATRMVEKGIDLLVVQEILGHSNIQTTMRYSHPVPERKQAAINILNDY